MHGTTTGEDILKIIQKTTGYNLDWNSCEVCDSWWGGKYFHYKDGFGWANHRSLWRWDVGIPKPCRNVSYPWTVTL